MGWEQSFLQDAVNTCTNQSGEVEDCPLFDIQDASVYDACTFTPPDAVTADNVLGPVATMAGDRKFPLPPSHACETWPRRASADSLTAAIQSGPAYATMGSAGSVSVSISAAVSATASAVVPTLSHSAGLSASGSISIALGNVFKAADETAAATTSTSAAPSSTSTETSTTETSEIASTTPAPVAADVESTSYYSTLYSTSGREAIEILVVEETVFVTATPTPSAAARHRRRHAHGRRDNF